MKRGEIILELDGLRLMGLSSGSWFSVQQQVRRVIAEFNRRGYVVLEYKDPFVLHTRVFKIVKEKEHA